MKWLVSRWLPNSEALSALGAGRHCQGRVAAASEVGSAGVQRVAPQATPFGR
jgi:hypothetical protein